MTDNELKVMTVNNMYGKWFGKDEKHEIHISITSEYVSVDIKNVNGELEKNMLPNSDFWWVGQFLNFFECKQRFYVLRADEHKMLFGESKNPTSFDGQNKWLIDFDRV